MIDKDKVEASIRDLLSALGENTDREGLRDTPSRVAKMYEEIFEGMNYTNDEIATMFDKCFIDDIDLINSSEVVWVKDIECFSFCEHHMALIYDIKITVAYKPKNKVIGISKIARIADMVCKRLQLQERITSDIFYIVKKITESDDILVKVVGKHSCMTIRGVKKLHATTKTIESSGIFKKL